MSDNSNKIRKRYNRASFIYDYMEKPMEMMGLKQRRLDLMKELQGEVLEVGVGTGKNIEFYPEGAQVTAIDFSEGMLEKAKLKAQKLGKEVKLLHMDAQHMEFPDNSFDTVFATCVFCSVPDPVQGLKEVRRVCKPGGKIIMLEHVRSEKKLLGILMDIMNPLVVNTYGANINRRTVDNIKKAEFTEVSAQDLVGDIVKKIVIRNDK
jgi:ubiquinone/menaquinone biosynthesis C-methylase UbiE